MLTKEFDLISNLSCNLDEFDMDEVTKVNVIVPPMSHML